MLGLSRKGAARADRRGSTCCSLPTAPGGPRRDLTPRCRGQAGGLRRPGHSGLLSGGRDAGRTAQGPTAPPGTATQGDTREHTPTDASFHPQSHRPWARVQRPCLPGGNCRRKGSKRVAAGGGAGATSVARKGQAVRTDGWTDGAAFRPLPCGGQRPGWDPVPRERSASWPWRAGWQVVDARSLSHKGL